LSERGQSLGLLDALSSGLSEALRRPWLVAIPFVLDLFIWLMPALSIQGLVNRVVVIWEALLRATYPADQLLQMQGVIDGVHNAAGEVGTSINLMNSLTGSWLGVPSALVAPQGSRLTFISDLIFAPIGVGLHLDGLAHARWQPAPIEINSVWLALLLVLLFWLTGLVFVAFFLRWATQGPRAAEGGSEEHPWAGAKGFAQLWIRITAFSLVLGAVMLFLRLPLGFMLGLVLLFDSGLGALLFATAGGITLWFVMWFLTSVFFAGETILLDRRPVLRSIMESVAMVRSHTVATLALAVTVNVLMVGFRVVWSWMGRTPAGAVLAMGLNAYLGTALILGIIVYYRDRRRKWEARLSQSARETNLRNKMKD
jgi:hypothetical protein